MKYKHSYLWHAVCSSKGTPSRSHTMRPTLLLSAAIAVLVAVLATPASAGPISGDVRLSGTFSKLPDVGTSSIVSDLRYLNVDHAATIGFSTGTGWFYNLDPTTVAVANNINLEGPIHFTYTVGDFRFLATSVSNTIRSTPVCTDTMCTDLLTFDIAGVVSAPGAFTTAFTGAWTGSGSCTALDSKCISEVTGHWDVYLDPPVGIAAVPEPGSMVLLGIALSVLGFGIRRRQA
jgi:hypothetical protein